MQKLFHITTQQDWGKAVEQGSYRADSLETEGFIHCSTEEQVAKTANAFYSTVPNLLLLEINQAKISAEIKWEAIDGDTFPHIYGPINLDAVDSVETFSSSQNGKFVYP
jgi:uncharacterized protein (DUF952 family)